MKKINTLTGARFTAIMIIVFAHFEFLEKYGMFGKVYQKFFDNATMGVDFFFMVSGFGMMLSYINKIQDKNNEKARIKMRGGGIEKA